MKQSGDESSPNTIHHNPFDQDIEHPYGHTLDIESSPHIRSGASVDIIMRNVVWALLPVSFFAIYVFGLATVLVLLTAVISCVATEYLLTGNKETVSPITDWSAVITGLLYGLTLPACLPLWMVACGGVIGVGLGKVLFGGLGYNVFNPALVGRAFLQAAFPTAMTTWTPAMMAERFSSVPPSLFTFPFTKPSYVSLPEYDGVSQATPLAQMKFDQSFAVTPDLLFGFSHGSLGETGAIFILLGGAWLVARKMMNWRIPLSILTTVAVMSTVSHLFDASQYPGPLFMLFSGGLMLGAVFMATDMVASPITSQGAILYGVIIGVLIVVIRLWGGMPEGVMYAILLANAISPHIDNLIRSRVFGVNLKK